MKRLTLFILLLSLSLLLPAAARAASDPKELMAFADHLFEAGDYYRAITEYERVAFLFPNDPLAQTARYRIALSYFQGDKLVPAIERFRSLAEQFPTEQIGKDALYMLGEAQYVNKDYRASRKTFASFLEAYPADPRCDAVRIRIGWSHMRERNWREAEEAFRGLPPDSPLHASAEGLAEGALAYPDIPRKSPTLAGTLSAVLPGAGQLYTGRTGDAVTSFLLNGIFIWGAVEAFHHDNDVTGGILLFFEAGWYTGNIYNAVSNAYKYNRGAEQNYLQRLDDRYAISLSHTRDGANLLAFTVRF